MTDSEKDNSQFRFSWSFLAPSERASLAWRDDFVSTFLERDIPTLGLGIPGAALRRFWTMLAHFHGQLWNAAEFARSLGNSEPTARRYLDVLAGAFVARALAPWFENIGKRQVKAPKVYIRDSGLLHALLGIPGPRDLERHPKVGASWEGFAIETVLARLRARPGEAYFWRTHTGAELDLLVVRGGQRLGFEIKYTDAPRVTPSMRIAIEDLHLKRLDVLHAGEHTFPLASRIRAVALGDVPRVVARLR